MNRQDQWLFEIPLAPASSDGASLKYETLLEQEWKISAGEEETFPFKRRINRTGGTPRKNSKQAAPSQQRRGQSGQQRPELARQGQRSIKPSTPQPRARQLLVLPSSGGFQSALFQGDPDLLAVLKGQLRLGRSGDPQYPAPIKSQGSGVAKVQQALVQLGYPIGIDGKYGNRTYNTVLNYKRRYQILTETGYLDGIVGSKTIRHLDSALPTSDEILVYHPLQGYGWMSRNKAALTEAEVEGYDDFGEFEVLGKDNRRLVIDTTAIPYRFICYLFLLFRSPYGDLIRMVGSGTLISERHVLTAAHNVLNYLPQPFSSNRDYVHRISAAPGRNGREFPFGRSDAVDWRIPTQWKRSADDKQFDFALLTLRDALGAVKHEVLGNRPLGFWSHPSLGGGTAISQISHKDLTVNLSGYPGDKCLDQPPDRPAEPQELIGCRHRPEQVNELHPNGSTQWTSSGKIIQSGLGKLSKSKGMTIYNLDSAGGQSGSPVWTNRQGGFRDLVAVHHGGRRSDHPPFNIDNNMGASITPDMLNQIRAWMKEDGVTPTF